jgi:predicted GNAT family acetyltransferase
MTEKRDRGSIAGDAAMPLDQDRTPVRNCILQLATSVVTVNLLAQSIAGPQVARLRSPDGKARHRTAGRGSLQTHQLLARPEAEFEIQRERAVMVGRLDETRARTPSFFGTLHDRLHQGTTHPVVLYGWIDCDRSDTKDVVALVEKIAADNPAIQLSDDIVEARVLDKMPNQTHSIFCARYIRDEIVGFRNRLECAVTDVPGRSRIGISAPPQLNLHLSPDFFEFDANAAALHTTGKEQLGATPMHQMSLIDRPVWASLGSRHAHLSVGTALARRYLPDVNRFASARDDAAPSLAALTTLISPGEHAYVLQVPDIVVPAGLTVARRARGVQMVAARKVPMDAIRTDIHLLGDADAPEMLALATLTEPGPFLSRTHTMGTFLGIRIDGRLAAMAGERFQFPGFTEVSGVCTHPDFRGLGLARSLSTAVASRIEARGELPFLHAWKTNHAAISLYESLGFELRSEVDVAVLERASSI